MPVSYKQRKGQAAKSRAVAQQRRIRSSINSTIQRSYGANMRRSMVPAVLRARGGMATEMKTCDGYVGTGTLGFLTAGVCQYLFIMPIEGASFYNRIARRTRGVSLEIKGTIHPSGNNTSAVPGQYGRYMILYDRQPNGAVPTVATILTDYAYDGTTVTASQSGLNPDNRDRFLVLRDRKIYLPALGASGATAASTAVTGTNTDMKSSLLNVSEYIKLNGLETQYKASSGGIGDVSTGSYLILLISDADANATAAWQLGNQTTGSARVRYRFYD